MFQGPGGYASSAVLSLRFERTGELLVEREVFECGSFVTQHGDTIPDVRFGWERYGTMNADRSNVILVNHFLLGFGHAAGRYYQDERYPGFWDDYIGPGKAIDTEKFCVIATDCLCNIYVGNPKVVTTGPASIDPRTGERYGAKFPILTIRDLVAAQKALLDSLGVTRLHAIMGAGFGGFQAYEFATAFPDDVANIIPVSASLETDGWQIGWLNAWMTPIRLDPAWKEGDYYGGEPPTRGLVEALKVLYLNARHWGALEESYSRNWEKDVSELSRPAGEAFEIELALQAAAERRARMADANHFLHLVKATQTFRVGAADGLTLDAALKRLKARVLTIHAPNDEIFGGPNFDRHIAAMARHGVRLERIDRADAQGHVEAVTNLGPVEDAIRRFLG